MSSLGFGILEDADSSQKKQQQQRRRRPVPQAPVIQAPAPASITQAAAAPADAPASEPIDPDLEVEYVHKDDTSYEEPVTLASYWDATLNKFVNLSVSVADNLHKLRHQRGLVAGDILCAGSQKPISMYTSRRRRVREQGQDATMEHMAYDADDDEEDQENVDPRTGRRATQTTASTATSKEDINWSQIDYQSASDDFAFPM
jgi:hypothetical protein